MEVWPRTSSRLLKYVDGNESAVRCFDRLILTEYLMISEIVDNRWFGTFLLSIDADLAARARAKGCAHCGGTLHNATYPGEPRGLPYSVEQIDRLRSFFFPSYPRRTPPPPV